MTSIPQKKHIKITLDFTITIDEDAPPTHQRHPEYNERQRRLVQAILSDKDRLNAYLQYQVAAFIEGLHWRDWDNILGRDEDGELQVLMPAIATLSKEDQAVFAEAERRDLFPESVEGVDDYFSTTLDASSVVVEDEK